MNMGDLHKKEPTGKTLLQRKAQWAGLSKKIGILLREIIKKTRCVHRCLHLEQ